MNLLDFQSILSDRKISIHYGTEDFCQELTTSSLHGLDQLRAQLSQAEILQRIEQRRTFSSAQRHLPNTLTLLQEDRAR